MEEFQKYFSRPLFTIIFRPKILFFVTYSILTGQTKVEFVIYWVLRTKTLTKGWHLIFSLDDLITVPLARFRQGTKAVFWFNFLLTT